MSWAHYLLQVNIYLVVFYCFYKLLLDRETYFVLNRLYLVLSGLFSLIIPFLRFDLFSEKVVSDKLYISVNELNSVVTNYAVLPQTQEQYDWGRLIVIIYLLGVFIYFLHFVYQMFAVNKLLNNVTANDAFSFFNRKSVGQNLPERATVDLHEDVHIKQLHTIDVIFFEIFAIITWFNPIIYLYKKSIKNIHEYLADEAAAKFQGDKEEYTMLLLSQAFGVRPNSLTNSFFTKSLIKKRIFMLHKQRSKKVAILKYGLFVPLFALTLILSSATIRKNNRILAVADQISLENAKSLVKQVLDAPMSVVDLIKPPAEPPQEVLQQNVILGDVISDNSNEVNANVFSDFFNYLSASIKYPEAAIKKRLQGNTIVNFTVKNGRIIDVVSQVELGSGCEAEVENGILSFNSSIPRDGKYSIKVAFRLENADTEFKNENITAIDSYNELSTLTVSAFFNREKLSTEKAAIEAYNALPSVTVTEPDNKIEKSYSYVSMASAPSFMGGMDKLNSFLAKSIRYPIAAADNDVQGTVIVNFIVEKDGTLTNIKADKKLGFGIDEEAIRVLKLTKKWYPAMQNGKAVRVAYSIPIKFTFEEEKKVSKATVVASIRLKNFAESENAPLFIVDGLLKENNALKDLDAKKIESIDVLKSTNAIALYGKKGENGAVIITSKKPENPRVSATLFK